MRHQESRNYIDYLTIDENLIERVDRFLEDNFKDLFTPAVLAQTMYTLSDVDARSLVNGKFNKEMKSILNSMEMASVHPDYKPLHQQNIFLTLHGENRPKRSFRKLLNDLRKYLRELSRQGFQWNVVYYSEYKARSEGVF